MAEATVVGGSTAEVVTEPTNQETVVLRLRKPKADKAIKWQEGTVDNEFMGKKKSKCCCIYTKPHTFDESDTESGDSDGEDCCHEHRVARRHVPKETPAPPQSDS